MKKHLIWTVLVMAPAVHAQGLPDGPGKAEAEKMCRTCHEMARSISKQQDKDGWLQTMNKMAAFGMKSTDQEFAKVLDYLSTHYPADPVPPINVNTASAVEMEAALSLRRSQSAEVIKFREAHGGFKSLDDLKKVPRIDVAKIDAKKDRIVF